MMCWCGAAMRCEGEKEVRAVPVLWTVLWGPRTGLGFMRRRGWLGTRGDSGRPALSTFWITANCQRAGWHRQRGGTRVFPIRSQRAAAGETRRFWRSWPGLRGHAVQAANAAAACQMFADSGEERGQESQQDSDG